jgi:ubiquinone/menaquinone biosynthesis C-methylase UbiE
MAKLEYGKEAAERLLAVYSTPDVKQQRTEFLKTIDLKVGERVLDVGSGPGFLARAIAKKVGTKGMVCGVDISEFFIQVAKSHNEDQPMISFSYGEATNLDFSNEEFDTVVCTQVLEYVQDVGAALKEFNRVLRKGGKVAILDTDWDSIVWNTSNRARMSRILTAWEAHATDPFLPRILTERMTDAGFKVDSLKIIPIYNPKYDPNTYSNRIIDLIVPFVLEHSNIKQEEVDAWSAELRNQNDQYAYFFSLNRYLFLGTKS